MVFGLLLLVLRPYRIRTSKAHSLTHRCGNSFYSDAVLRSLNRSLGIQQWIDLRHGRYVPLERALAAFDMFTSQGDEMDFNKVRTGEYAVVASVDLS